MGLDLVERTAAFIEKKELVPDGASVLLSLSAGKDSMALYHIMKTLSFRKNLTLSVFHLNHCVRGDDADADEQFIKDLCLRDGIEAVFARHDFSKEKTAFEQKARCLRYELIADAMNTLGCTHAATAHTCSDQAETILMRCCTGTHIRGLEGIPAKRGSIIRPLLFADSNEIKDYLRLQKITWREDLSNEDTHYARNYLRHEILPRLEERFPGSAAAIAQISAAAAESRSMSLYLLEREGLIIETSEQTAAVTIKPPLLQKEVFAFCLAELVSRVGGYLSRERVDEAFRRMHSVKPELVIYDDGSVIAERSRLRDRLSARRKCASAAEGEWSVSFDLSDLPLIRQTDSYCFHACLVSLNECENELGRTDAVFLTIGEKETQVTIRSRKNGDILLSGGMTRKIKELFIDAKLSAEEKRRVPIVEICGRTAAVLTGFTAQRSNRISDIRLVHAASKKILAIYHGQPES
jgi:tRNA(Ile)-lysidine synthase